MHAGPLEKTRALELKAAPRPRRLPQSSRAPTSVLRSYPEDWPRRCPSATLPGLHGYGSPFQGFSRLPVFENPWLDAPETAADVEHAEIESEADEDTEEDFPFSYPVRRYNPTGTLFPPRYLMPGATLAYGDTLMAMVSTSSWDTLMQWFYGGFLSYRSDNDYVGWGLTAAYNKLIPVFTVGAYSYTVRYGKVFVEDAPLSTADHGRGPSLRRRTTTSTSGRWATSTWPCPSTTKGWLTCDGKVLSVNRGPRSPRSTRRALPCTAKPSLSVASCHRSAAAGGRAEVRPTDEPSPSSRAPTTA